MCARKSLFRIISTVNRDYGVVTGHGNSRRRCLHVRVSSSWLMPLDLRVLRPNLSDSATAATHQADDRLKDKGLRVIPPCHCPLRQSPNDLVKIALRPAIAMKRASAYPRYMTNRGGTDMSANG